MLLLQEAEHAFSGLIRLQDLEIGQIKILVDTPFISTGPTSIAAVKLKWLYKYYTIILLL